MLTYYVAHQALSDIKAMKRVMLETGLVTLSALPTRTAIEQLDKWRDMKTVHHRTSQLIRALGKPAITSNQAKRLDSLGFTRESLIQLCKDCSSTDHFVDALKKKGVNSKQLQAKLSAIVPALLKRE